MVKVRAQPPMRSGRFIASWDGVCRAAPPSAARQIHPPSGCALSRASDGATHSLPFYDINDDQVFINDLIRCEIPSGYTGVNIKGFPPLC